MTTNAPRNQAEEVTPELIERCSAEAWKQGLQYPPWNSVKSAEYRREWHRGFTRVVLETAFASAPPATPAASDALEAAWEGVRECGNNAVEAWDAIPVAGYEPLDSAMASLDIALLELRNAEEDATAAVEEGGRDG